MDIKILTPEEIQTLQVDAALRLIGEYTTLLPNINNDIGQALIELGQAKLKLDRARNDKETVIEMLRGLKVMAEKA